jgi:hypothetical protein
VGVGVGAGVGVGVGVGPGFEEGDGFGLGVVPGMLKKGMGMLRVGEGLALGVLGSSVIVWHPARRAVAQRTPTTHFLIEIPVSRIHLRLSHITSHRVNIFF